MVEWECPDGMRIVHKSQHPLQLKGAMVKLRLRKSFCKNNIHTNMPKA